MPGWPADDVDWPPCLSSEITFEHKASVRPHVYGTVTPNIKYAV